MANTLFNVTAYGAVGDSIKDDTAAINAAIAALNAAGRGCLYFPGGVYRITSALTPINNCAVTVKGDGIRVSILLDVSVKGSVLTINGGPGTNTPVTVHDLSFKTVQAATSTALTIQYPASNWYQPLNRVILRDLDISGALTNGQDSMSGPVFNTGIYLLNTPGAIIRDIGIAGCNGTNMADANRYKMTYGIHVATNGTTDMCVMRFDNVFVSFGYYGIFCEGGLEGLQFNQMTIVGVHVGIACKMGNLLGTAPHCTISNSHVGYFVDYAFYVEGCGPGVFINNNLLYGNVDSTTSGQFTGVLINKGGPYKGSAVFNNTMYFTNYGMQFANCVAPIRQYANHVNSGTAIVPGSNYVTGVA